jgi:hypothetical protein
MAIVETVKIKDPLTGYRVINKHHFNPEVHKLATGKEQPDHTALEKGAKPKGGAGAGNAAGTATGASGATSLGGEAAQKELKELVLVLDDKLGTAAGLSRITDDQEFPAAKVDELAGLLQVDKRIFDSDKKYRQRLLEAATKLMV